MRHCIRCDKDKPADEFSKYKYTTTAGNPGMRYESRCKQCNRERRRARYQDPEKGAMDRATSQAWKKDNAEHLKQYSKRRQQDAGHRANKAKAQRLRKARIRAGSDNNDQAIKDIYQLAMDTEKKLFACVECDDELELKMHVDHIEPLCLGGKHIASNLQILSARANLLKGSEPVKPEEVAPHG